MRIVTAIVFIALVAGMSAGAWSFGKYSYCAGYIAGQRDALHGLFHYKLVTNTTVTVEPIELNGK